MALNLTGNKRSAAFNVINDPEFMLKYQVVSLAKNHNYYGAIDQYMREFAGMCVKTGDRTLTRNLERVLNAEVSINLRAQRAPVIGSYKDLPREIDPVVLAQPDFEF